MKKENLEILTLTGLSEGKRIGIAASNLLEGIFFLDSKTGIKSGGEE